jgi:hypothetical protein
MECALTIVLLQVLVLLALSGAASSAAGTAVGVRHPAGDASMSTAPEAYHQLVEPIGRGSPPEDGTATAGKHN